MNRKFLAMLTTLVLVFSTIVPAFVFATDSETFELTVNGSQDEQSPPAGNDSTDNSQETPAGSTVIEFVDDQPQGDEVNNTNSEENNTAGENQAQEPQVPEGNEPVNDPVTEPQSEQQEDAPAPIVDTIPDQPSDDLSKAFKKFTIKGTPEDPIANGDRFEAVVKFVSGQKLDSIIFEINQNSFAELTRFNIDAIENASENNTYTVYKLFKVDDKESYKMPLASQLSPMQPQEISNLEKSFDAIAYGKEDATAEFVGTYLIQFDNNLSSSISGEIKIVGKMKNANEGDHAGVSVRARYAVGTLEPEYTDKIKKTFDYKAPEKIEEPEQQEEETRKIDEEDSAAKQQNAQSSAAEQPDAQSSDDGQQNAQSSAAEQPDAQGSDDEQQESTVPHPARFSLRSVPTRATATNSITLIAKAIDKDTNEPVEGVTFAIATGDNALPDGVAPADGKATTDNQGKATFTLPAVAENESWEYSVSVTNLPEIYDINDNKKLSKQITINEATPSETTINCQLRSKLQEQDVTFNVIVKDKDTEATVSGVSVKLESTAHQYSEDKETGENGVAVFSVKGGYDESGNAYKYTATITELPKEYRIAQNLVSTEIKDVTGERTTINLTISIIKATEETQTENFDATFSVKVSTIENDEKKPVSGAKVFILDSNNTEIGNITTDENGSATTTLAIYAGEYAFACAKSGWDGCELYSLKNTKTTPTAVTADSPTLTDEIILVTKEQEAEQEANSASLTISVTCKDTHDPIEGVKFVAKLRDSDKEYEFITDSSGKAEKTNMAVGTYVLQEVSVPDMYVSGMPNAEITITKNQHSTYGASYSMKEEFAHPSATLRITVMDDRLESTVPGASVLVAKVKEGDAAPEEYAEKVTGEDGVVTFEKVPAGQYIISVSNTPAGYVVDPETGKAEYTIEKNIATPVEISLHVNSEEPVIEDLEIVEFSGLKFDPETINAIPTTAYTMNLGGFKLVLNKEGETASQLLFRLKNITPAESVKFKFAGTASSYRVLAYDQDGPSADGGSPIAEKSGENVTVEFDSTKIPVVDPETGEPIEGAVGTFPEGTMFVWVYVTNPSADFAVEEFTISGNAPKNNNVTPYAQYTVGSEVSLYGSAVAAQDESTGSVLPGEPEATMTLTPSSEAITEGDPVSFTLSFANDSATGYVSSGFELDIPENFMVKELNLGAADNYNGMIAVKTEDNSGESTDIGKYFPNSIVSSGLSNASKISIIPVVALNGTESFAGITVSGVANKAGTAEVKAKFTGTLALPDLIWTTGATASVTVNEKVIPQGTVTINAYMKEEGDKLTPVKGVEFPVYREGKDGDPDLAIVKVVVSEEESYQFYGILVGTLTTDENGTATTTLPADNYLIIADKVPEGYEEINYSKRFTIAGGDAFSDSVELKTKTTPDVTEEPTPTPTPTPGGGGVNPPHDNTTPEPEETPVALAVDSPQIYATSNTIQYGDEGIFNIRNLNAVGLDTDNYYVLHVMIPQGVQVKSIAFPGFGESIKVSLAYQSGSSELGNYMEKETVMLTDRQGSNMKYIAFQMRNVTSVKPDGEITIMLKNISARDRVATLQAILSVRDAKTAVREQHYDKFNIALSGPKTGSPSSPSSPSADEQPNEQNGLTEKGLDAIRTTNNLPPIANYHPDTMLKNGGAGSVNVINLLQGKKEIHLYPLLVPIDDDVATIRDTGATTIIAVNPVTDARIKSFIYILARKQEILRTFTKNKSTNPIARILRVY